MTQAHAPSGPVGGFFEAADPGPCVGQSVLDSWVTNHAYAAFVSARAAFAALAEEHPRAAIWAPAFVCPDLLQGVDPVRVRFYPVGEGFAPDLIRVEAEAMPGDILVLVSHFGLPVDSVARRLAKDRADLIVVEDRAQALDPRLPGCGGYRLYSPRKLLGVADGGILVAPDVETPPEPTGPADADALWRAPLLRAADPEGRDNARWHAENQAKEAAMPAAPQMMTDRSREVLAATAIAPLAEARLANWRTLNTRLAGWSALPAVVDAPPLGYVLRLRPDARDNLLSALHAARIFAAVHWRKIAAPEQDFPREAAWTRELLTLPCDHRYGRAEMERIADLVLEHVA